MIFNVTALEALSPNLWILIANLIAFSIVIIILIIFAWKPTKKFMNDRKDLINKEIQTAKDNKKNAEDLFQPATNKVIESKENATKIEELSEEKAHQYWENMVSKAKAEANLIKKKSQIDIDKLEIEFEKNKNEEIVNVALIAAEELMKKKINNEENKKLVDSILDAIISND